MVGYGLWPENRFRLRMDANGLCMKTKEISLILNRESGKSD